MTSAGAISPPRRGTRRRGAETRLAVLEATIAIVGREGGRALTHRRVASEAGVSLSATTYYFESKEDLLRSGLELVIDRDTERIAGRLSEMGERESARGVADEIAGWYGEEAVERPETWTILLELVNEAARSGILVPQLAAWNESADAAILAALEHAGRPHPLAARTIRACADGLVIEQLFLRRPDFHAAVLRPTLRKLVPSLLTAR